MTFHSPDTLFDFFLDSLNDMMNLFNCKSYFYSSLEVQKKWTKNYIQRM